MDGIIVNKEIINNIPCKKNCNVCLRNGITSCYEPEEILKQIISNNEPIEIVMRDATKEELKGVNDYIKSISTHTGKSFYS